MVLENGEVMALFDPFDEHSVLRKGNGLNVLGFSCEIVIF